MAGIATFYLMDRGIRMRRHGKEKVQLTFDSLLTNAVLENGSEDISGTEPALTIGTTWYPKHMKLGTYEATFGKSRLAKWSERSEDREGKATAFSHSIECSETTRVPLKYIVQFQLDINGYEKAEDLYGLEHEFKFHLQNLGLADLLTDDGLTVWVWKEIAPGEPIDYPAFMEWFLKERNISFIRVNRDDYPILPLEKWTKEDIQMVSWAQQESKQQFTKFRQMLEKRLNGKKRKISRK